MYLYFSLKTLLTKATRFSTNPPHQISGGTTESILPVYLAYRHLVHIVYTLLLLTAHVTGNRTCKTDIRFVTTVPEITAFGILVNAWFAPLEVWSNGYGNVVPAAAVLGLAAIGSAVRTTRTTRDAAFVLKNFEYMAILHVFVAVAVVVLALPCRDNIPVSVYNRRYHELTMFCF